MSVLTQATADGLVMAKRNLIKVKRIPDLLIFTTIQPVMFVLLFAYVFGGAIPSRRRELPRVLDGRHLHPDRGVRLGASRRSDWPTTFRKASSTGSGRYRWRGRRCSSAARLSDLFNNVHRDGRHVGLRTARGLAHPPRGRLRARARTSSFSRSRSRCRGCRRRSGCQYGASKSRRAPASSGCSRSRSCRTRLYRRIRCRVGCSRSRTGTR